jgi:hypothetical protein
MSLHKNMVALSAICTALACVFAFATSPASAEITHTPEPSFNGASAPGGPFGIVAAVAVDNSKGPSKGDVYVGNFSFSTFGSYVEKFEANGTYAGVSITATPSGPISILNLSTFLLGGLAVDGSSGPNRGDLYIADPTNDVVDKFTEAGIYVCHITAKTPVTTTEKTEECNGSVGSQPAGGSGFAPTGLAVEPASGDIYVSDAANDVVDTFGPNGEYISQISSTHITRPGVLAVDGSGHVYVANNGVEILEFNTRGVFISTLAGNEKSGAGEKTSTVALDPTTGYPYVPYTEGEGEKPSIAEYEASGTEVGRFAKGEAKSTTSLAVGPTGRTYVGGFGDVQVFGPSLTVPDVTAAQVTAIKQQSAVLNGRADPDAAHGGGPVTGCTFEYVDAADYNPSAVNPYAAGQTASCLPTTPYSAATNVAAGISGLTPDTVYHWRLIAENAEGVNRTADQMFTTAGPATIEAQPATAEATNATIRANVDPYGYETKCHVQYVSETEFQASGYAHAATQACTNENLDEGYTSVLARAYLKGLSLATVYHYRFLVESQAQAGALVEPDRTFETFAIKSFAITATNALGQPYTQAGGRPYELKTAFFFNETETAGGQSEVTANIKNVTTDLPPGMIGNPTAVAECTSAEVTGHECSGNAQVGVIDPYGFGLGQSELAGAPLFNVVPGAGQAARFEAEVTAQIKVAITASVRGGSDYGVSAGSISIQADTGISGIEVILWGVPGEAVHDGERGCPYPNPAEHQGWNKGCKSTFPLEPFLRMPTSCTGKPLTGALHVNSWQDQGAYVEAHTEMPPLVGCGLLPFEPSLEAPFTTGLADSPTGLNVDLHNPQPQACKEEASVVTCENGEADLRNAKIVLPAGMAVNPSSADGLEACSEAQIGYLPQRSAEVGHPQFTPGPAECPDASKIGSVEVKTPLLNHPLSGAMYIATQNANPFKSLLATYIAIYDPASGVVVKLPGKVELDSATGQITASFDEDPQLPFEDFRVSVFSGSRAALTTPATCGSYSTSTEMTPWSAPEGKMVSPSSKPSAISAAPGGAACASSEAQAPNAPAFEAGTASPVGGAYSPFVLHLAREDASQHFSSLNVTLPPGLIGKIAGLEQCPQAAIEAAQARGHEGEGAVELAHPSCPVGSEVGLVHVGAGSGAPYYVSGHAYFAGPYKGAPFSLVIVTPAIAGPFDLGSVVVRAGLYIDPNTAQVTVKSDPFPRILDGIPLDIRSVNVDVNRSEFTLNPTSCAAMAVSGEESSTAGQTAVLSDRFQAGGCANLPFKPGFTVSTSAKATRADGTSVTFKISYPASALGKEAWLSAAKFEFPKQLPARLSTIQKACPAGTFDANPASCGVGSRIGTAVVRTQLLGVPLEGPVYFVSNGNQKFPEAVIVLQGDGVTVDLHSETFINEKTGVTSATLPAIPGVPFEEATVTLPSGQYSEFTANTNLCGTSKTVTVKKRVTVKSKGHEKTVTRKVKESVTSALALSMPTMFTGQNGAQITQSTPITVTECAKVVKSKAKPKTVKHKKKSKGKVKKKK